jgi:hypothetical protein
MRKQLMWAAAVAAVAFLALGYAETVRATPALGFASSTIALGRFGDIDVSNHLIREFGDTTPRKDLWLSMQKTKGPSDLYVQNNEWALGGTSGWHTHPGHSLVIITAGAVTVYDADDPTCTGTVYSSQAINGVANMSFVDAGGDHAHLVRNEGGVIARAVAVQLIPAGAARRIDLTPGPDTCPF